MKSPFKRLALALCIPMLSIPVLSTLSALPLMAHEDKSAVSEIKQSYLSDVKSKADLENIQVVKLASDEYASDFVVFIKKNVPLHKHLTHTETVYVLEGTGIFQYGDEKITIGP
ncbi:MAG: quercetin dioxygenase-like cupin family protein, partial [Alteromonadaceae bacterium]